MLRKKLLDEIINKEKKVTEVAELLSVTRKTIYIRLNNYREY